jgi:Transglutaminase-like superfamily
MPCRATIFALFVAFSANTSAADESWDLIRVGTIKIGHQHVVVKRLTHQGRDLVNVQVNTVVVFKRNRDRVFMEVRYGTIETPEGVVLRLETREVASNTEKITKGETSGGKMHLTVEAGGDKQAEVIDWGEDVRGPYGAEMSLAREPIAAGEKRVVKTFVPTLNRICLSKLTARGLEKVETGVKNETRELMRVDMEVTDLNGKEEPGTRQVLWVDAGGQILRAVSELLGGTFAYRTTKSAANAPNGAFDLVDAGVVKVPQPIRDPEKTRGASYRVSFKDGDPAALFPTDARQVVKKTGAGAAILEVRTMGPHDGKAESSPGEEFLRPNSMINSDDPEVMRLMRKAVNGRTDPWEMAVAIENWVFQGIRTKNYSIAFAPAAEVARNLEGDCTEHSVLTAAMCRAAGIPARVAVGLLYAEKIGGFGQHMWNEVYVNGRWVAIDAAFNESAVDAVHIKLSDSSLTGISPYDAFMPVIKAWGKLTLEPFDIRR